MLKTVTRKYSAQFRQSQLFHVDPNSFLVSSELQLHSDTAEIERSGVPTG